MSLNKKLKELRKSLYKILESPAETHNIKSSINQCISMDEKAIKELQASDRDIYIIQAAQINAQIIRHSTKALAQIDEIEDKYLNPHDLNCVLYDMLIIKRLRWEDILGLVEKNLIKIAQDEAGKNKSQAARTLGLKRTTYLEKIERNQEYKDEIIDVKSSEEKT